MTIKAYDIIRYILNGEYVIIQNSNVVSVKLINPIIKFKKLICGDLVKIVIDNQSGVTIRNICYKDCNASDCMKLKINNICFENINIKKGICLGTLKNNQTITMCYRNSFKTSSLLSYNFIINNQINQIYLVDNKGNI